MAGRRDGERLETFSAAEMERRIKGYEGEVLRNYAAALDSIRSDIAKIYDRYAINGELTYAEMAKFNRLAKLEKQITEDIGPSAIRTRSLMERMPRVEYDEAFYRYAWTIDQQAGVSLQWGLLNRDTAVESVATPMRKIAEARLRADGRLKIRRAVTQGLIRGVSFPSMMRGIRDAINGTAKDALRIVRTEGQRAQVLGQQASYNRARERGVEVVDVWDATLDSRTRAEHGVLDGVRAQYDDGGAFWNTSVGKVRGPLRSGVASFDINCRCRIRGEIDGFEPEVRRIRGQGAVPYQNYEDWRKGLNQRGRNVELPKEGAGA